MARREERVISRYMSILPVRPLTRPSPPLDRLAAEGGEQRSQTGCIGVPKCEVIFARTLSRRFIKYTNVYLICNIEAMTPYSGETEHQYASTQPI